MRLTKAFILVLVSSAFSLTCWAQTVGADKGEKEFEIEQEKLDFQDLDAQRKSAEQEAVRSEHEAKDLEHQLNKARVQRKSILKRAEEQIQSAETRRKKATKFSNNARAEMDQIHQQNQALEEKVATLEQRAKEQEQLKNEASEALKAEKKLYVELSARQKRSEAQLKRDTLAVKSMKVQWTQLKVGLKGLDERIRRQEVENQKNRIRIGKMREAIERAQARKEEAQRKLQELRRTPLPAVQSPKNRGDTGVRQPADVRLPAKGEPTKRNIEVLEDF